MVLIVTVPNKPAICRDHICRDQIVDRKSVPGAQPSDPAGQGQPGHAGLRDETPGRRKAMRLTGLVDIAPQGATFNASNARLGQIGRASCRERGCEEVCVTVDGVYLKKTNKK